MSASQASRGPEHDAVARAMRTRTMWVRGLSALIIALYFAFMSLFAFDEPLLGIVLVPGLTLALLLGPALILTAVLISVVYVLWANLAFDPMVAALAAQLAEETP